MRIFALFFIMMLLVPINSCCCNLPTGMTGVNKNLKQYKSIDKQVIDDESEDSQTKQIAPLEGALMMRKLQSEMQELMTEMENSDNLDEDELTELQAKIEQKQEEMVELSEATMNSDFMKDQSNNPLIKKAIQEQRKAKKANEQAVMSQKQLQDELEDKLDNQSGKDAFEEDPSVEEGFELDPENDSEFKDDVYMPDEF